MILTSRLDCRRPRPLVNHLSLGASVSRKSAKLNSTQLTKQTSNSARFFDDQPEPIYQWIPELNKRVYSDHFERYLDKSYQVSEDADFMLASYRKLLSSAANRAELVTLLPIETTNSLANKARDNNHDDDVGNSARTTTLAPTIELTDDGRDDDIDDDDDDPTGGAAGRRLLADRLLRLSRLGGRQSRKLLEQLRRALHMDQTDFSRYRALRLVRPDNKLAGRYTCSVSSLEGDDLRSTRLQVFGECQR